ncbi:MAG: hypothetical protein WCG04_07215 [Alphaproteobacteria bacterium]
MHFGIKWGVHFGLAFAIFGSTSMIHAASDIYFRDGYYVAKDCDLFGTERVKCCNDYYSPYVQQLTGIVEADKKFLEKAQADLDNAVTSANNKGCDLTATEYENSLISAACAMAYAWWKDKLAIFKGSTRQLEEDTAFLKRANDELKTCLNWVNPKPQPTPTPDPTPAPAPTPTPAPAQK